MVLVLVLELILSESVEPGRVVSEVKVSDSTNGLPFDPANAIAVPTKARQPNATVRCLGNFSSTDGTDFPLTDRIDGSDFSTTDGSDFSPTDGSGSSPTDGIDFGGSLIGF